MLEAFMPFAVYFIKLINTDRRLAQKRGDLFEISYIPTWMPNTRRRERLGSRMRLDPCR